MILQRWISQIYFASHGVQLQKKNNTVPHLNSSFQLAWLSKPVVWIKLHQMSGSNVIPNQNHMQRHKELSLKKKCDKFKLSSAGRCKFSFKLHDECLASPEVSCCAYYIFCLTKWKKNVSWKFDKKKTMVKNKSTISSWFRDCHLHTIFTWHIGFQLVPALLCTRIGAAGTAEYWGYHMHNCSSSATDLPHGQLRVVPNTFSNFATSWLKTIGLLIFGNHIPITFPINPIIFKHGL